MKILFWISFPCFRKYSKKENFKAYHCKVNAKPQRKDGRNRRETTIKISNNQKNSDLNYHKGLIHTNPTLVFKELMDDHATRSGFSQALHLFTNEPTQKNRKKTRKALSFLIKT